jgi:hypothetical protein
MVLCDISNLLSHPKKTRLSFIFSGRFVSRCTGFPDISHIIQEPTSRFQGLDLRIDAARNLWLAGYDLVVLVAVDSVSICMINHSMGLYSLTRHPRL